MITKAEHNTKILPLRWFANFCNHIGTPSLVKMFDLQDYGITSGFRWKFHGLIWKWTYAIYKKWGTTYSVIDWELNKEDANKYLGVNNDDDWDTID